MNSRTLNRLALIGAPTSAGAYAPGQEKAPDALRAAGLLDRLSAYGFDCADLGNVEGFRWRADRDSPRAMNVEQVRRIAGEVAAKVADAVADDRFALVIGGDCTVELGTLAGMLRASDDVGLVYFDLDADMNTPETTSDGALDWMGVAHMLGVKGSLPELGTLAGRQPMIAAQDLLLFGCSNIKPPEAALIASLGIETICTSDVRRSATGAGVRAAAWGGRFERLLIHLDVDAIDFEDFPIAENVRRKAGLPFECAMRALEVALGSPNVAALTVCEVNPDHGDPDEATVNRFVERLGQALHARLQV